MKILVIDDDDRIRRMVAKVLGADGHQVTCAADGAAGVAVFRQENPDAVVTDIIMPEQEGIETIVTIRRERPDTKIIAISGGGRLGDIELLRMARLLGADDVIPKPFRAHELRRRVRALGASRTLPDFPA
jgi:two-component system, chemotaxis family, chemotaxis protein CheY